MRPLSIRMVVQHKTWLTLLVIILPTSHVNIVCNQLEMTSQDNPAYLVTSINTCRGDFLNEAIEYKNGCST